MWREHRSNLLHCCDQEQNDIPKKEEDPQREIQEKPFYLNRKSKSEEKKAKTGFKTLGNWRDEGTSWKSVKMGKRKKREKGELVRGGRKWGVNVI